LAERLSGARSAGRRPDNIFYHIEREIIVRRTIDGKAYDTDTATLVASGDHNHELSQAWWSLYRTTAGAWFEVAADHDGVVEGFQPLTDAQARRWLERHANELVEQYVGQAPEASSADHKGLRFSRRTLAAAIESTVSGQQTMEKIKILFVSANPTGTTPLKLDEEVREIEAKIRAAAHRDSLELITKWAVRPDDLLQSLNQHRPHVVHFSGHGSSAEEIILLDKLGKPKPVSKEALVSLFHALKDNIRVVLLNALFFATTGRGNHGRDRLCNRHDERDQ
jgi:hypothetical protein